MTKPLRLRAEDAHDLAVVAAVLQDARIPVHEMVFQPEQSRFMAAFSRYRRELLADPTSCEGLTQIRSCLTLEGIAAVKVRGLPEADPDPELALLTIALEPGKDQLIHVNLLFEGDVAVQLRTDAIACRLEDFGEAWQPTVTPCDHFAEGDPPIASFADNRFEDDRAAMPGAAGGDARNADAAR